MFADHLNQQVFYIPQAFPNSLITASKIDHVSTASVSFIFIMQNINEDRQQTNDQSSFDGNIFLYINYLH